MGAATIKLSVQREHTRAATPTLIGHTRFPVCDSCLRMRINNLDVATLEEPLCKIIAAYITAKTLEEP